MSGLSPRVRGNRQGESRRECEVGSIPACAGEPPPRRRGRGCGRVYPRVCGGTSWRPPSGPTGRGLSPRVRGNPGVAAIDAGRGGSIPACAGEPDTATTACSASRVYPRVCGGTLDDVERCQEYGGLSPRVRGNRHHLPSIRSMGGSIPACAGEPIGSARRRPGTGVYPRVCGGTPDLAHVVVLDGGLSPRVRGNPVESRRVPSTMGSIPACAGEPSGPSAIWNGSGVYPRVCGGTTPHGRPPSGGEGLSPRVRGNPARRMRGARAQGSIPACAGEPSRRSFCGLLRGVYPRVCGGTWYNGFNDVYVRGLSPRVRGNHR